MNLAVPMSIQHRAVELSHQLKRATEEKSLLSIDIDVTLENLVLLHSHLVNRVCTDGSFAALNSYLKKQVLQLENVMHDIWVSVKSIKTDIRDMPCMSRPQYESQHYPDSLEYAHNDINNDNPVDSSTLLDYSDDSDDESDDD
jgi:hypothetical protein